jgi:hypothetical protein
VIDHDGSLSTLDEVIYPGIIFLSGLFMEHHQSPTCIAFEGTRRVAAGDLSQVALEVKKLVDRGERAPILIFDDRTSALVEVDLRGSADDVLDRLIKTNCDAGAHEHPSEQLESVRRPGRPKLGVVAREVTLLPRHWDWLNSQPGGASVALRKLVEEARRVNETKDRVRQSQESAYRFTSAMAGNESGFEEAMRALFACNRDRFDQAVDSWPIDVRDHAKRLAAGAFSSAP